MKGKEGKQKGREHLCCLFIGCIFKFVNLLYGAYPEFTHSVVLFLVSDKMQKEKSHVPIKPPTGFVAKVVRKFYTDGRRNIWLHSSKWHRPPPPSKMEMQRQKNGVDAQEIRTGQKQSPFS